MGMGPPVARFAFRFHPLYRVLGLPFGVTPGTSLVEVVDDHLVVRFGPWHLRTPVTNIVGCDRSGPYAVWKTAGPARLSLADRGVTFATNRDAGLCIRFATPVPAIDPFRRILHPGITLTVKHVDDLQRRLTPSSSTTEVEDRSEGVPAESPGAIARRWARWPFGMMLVTLRYLQALGDVDRSHESRQSPAPPLPTSSDHGTELQSVDDGVGEIFERTYRVRIAGSTQSPEELLAFVTSNFNRATPVEVAEFSERRPKGDGPEVGSEYEIRMPGPWNGSVRTVARTSTSIRLATLDGHMEAGQIEFRTSWADSAATSDGNRDLVFEIYSVARSADRAFSALYSYIPVAREMQLYMWVHFCRRVAEMAKGTIIGKPVVRTVRYKVDDELPIAAGTR
jgi:hypothetical protein